MRHVADFTINTQESLSRAMFHLHNPQTPAIIRETIPTYIELVQKVTESDSLRCMNKLQKLLADLVIGGIWIYASRDMATIEASVLSLPIILKALGIVSVRFLRVC